MKTSLHLHSQQKIFTVQSKQGTLLQKQIILGNYSVTPR